MTEQIIVTTWRATPPTALRHRSPDADCASLDSRPDDLSHPETGFGALASAFPNRGYR